ncbi:PA14 domain-containing protein [Tenacibaculum sp. C7A-26P2]|uniref:PA14 domain-containing protein n=1 Tax=Tenacibaculum sp. C7A-26P2 TaxID=3447504 RepID=UPI003F836607
MNWAINTYYSLVFVLNITSSIYAQIDRNSLLALPSINKQLELKSIITPKEGSLVMNKENRKIYYYNGINWLPIKAGRELERGLQHFFWVTGNISKPDISNFTKLGIPTSSGSVKGRLNNRLRENISSLTNGYIICLRGILKVNNPGKFNFISHSSDGSRIYVDNFLILENWDDQKIKKSTGNVTLAKGEHSIEFWYYQNRGGGFMKFKWGNNPDGYILGSTIRASQFFVK